MPSMVGTHAGGEAPCEGMEGALREHEMLGCRLFWGFYNVTYCKDFIEKRNLCLYRVEKILETLP